MCSIMTTGSLLRYPVLILCTTTACFAGSDDQTKGIGGDTNAPPSVARSTPRPGIRFDPSTLQPGTRIGPLMADSIHKRLALDSTWVGTAWFQGTTQLNGWTLRHPDPDLQRSTTCFEADSSSASRLPRWTGDERRPWFCFSNRVEAARFLGTPSEGFRATIEVDEFTIHRGLSDEVNSAHFIRLVRRGT
jgi:hypothetical protein